jgi:DNA-binding GntR family transcriptional regulator
MLPLRRSSLPDSVAALLRDRILAGAVPGGTALRQEALAAEFGVSRIPLREALRRLEAEGLVNIQPHRGAVVAELPLEDADELFSLRALLESDLARRAVPHLTADDIVALETAAHAFERAMESEDVAHWGDANQALHLALYRAADRPRTLEIVNRLHQQCDRLLRLQLLRTIGGGDRAIREHRAIVNSARAGDAEGTAELIHQHIIGVGTALAQALASGGAEGKAEA